MIRTPLLLARNDLRMLTRTRVLAVLLVLYPLAMAAILGGVLLNQGPPTIAFVNEDLSGDVVKIGDHEFSVSDYVHRAEKNGVDVQRMSAEEAQRALDDGQVAGILTIPQGTAAKLRTQLSGVDLKFTTGDNPLGSVVAQRMKGVVYSINLAISDALIDTNREYLDTLVTGGEVNVDGEEFDLYGLAPIKEDLEEARDELEEADADEDLLERLERAIDFARDAGSAIGLADNALEATAAPVRIDVDRAEGKSPMLTAQAIAFALAVATAFICMVLVAASLAAERDEAVLGRLLRGIARAWQIIVGKLLFGCVLAAVFGLGVFAAFAVLAPQAWDRLPLLIASVAVASLASSGIGAVLAVLMRDARTATLVAILLVLPLVPLALIGLEGPAAVIEGFFPIAPSRELFNAVLFESDPWDVIIRSGAQLLAIAAVSSAIAMRLLRRLA